MAEIGLYELKTRISEVVRAVQAGKRFTVTRRGRPVCALVPFVEAEVQPRDGEAWDSFWLLAEEIACTEVVDPRPSVEILAEQRR